MSTINRRRFISNTARGMVGFGMASTYAVQSAAKTDKANDTVLVGCIGQGGRGRSHTSYLAAKEDTEVAWICDVDLKISS